ncbi:unnamed protein product [Amoebophrya sp. A120]|nr:unnamed protein product [Amoebophrya sp. A120]|eukprot:GSA120T00023260001.1
MAMVNNLPTFHSGGSMPSSTRRGPAGVKRGLQTVEEFQPTSDPNLLKDEYGNTHEREDVPVSPTESEAVQSEHSSDSPSEDKSGSTSGEGEGANFAKKVYTAIPIPFDFFGIGKRTASAADTYLLNPIVGAAVTGARQTLLPQLEKWAGVDTEKAQAKEARNRKRMRAKGGNSKKRTKSAERQMNESELQQQLLNESAMQGEPETEPHTNNSTVMNTPRGVMTRPSQSYMQPMLTPRGQMVRPSAQSYMDDVDPSGMGSIVASEASIVRFFVVMHRTTSPTPTAATAALFLMRIIVNSKKWKLKPKRLKTHLDGTLSERERKKMELLGIGGSFQPLYARMNKSWDFPLNKTEVNDRLTLGLHFENKELKQDAAMRFNRQTIQDWRGGSQHEPLAIREAP